MQTALIIAKRTIKFFLLGTLIFLYLCFYIPQWFASFFIADWHRPVSIWGEFFPSKARLERDQLQQELIRQNTNMLDKVFIIVFRSILKW